MGSLQKEKDSYGKCIQGKYRYLNFPFRIILEKGAGCINFNRKRKGKEYESLGN
jgi:hypothetical protein